MAKNEALSTVLQWSGEVLSATESPDAFAGLEQSAQILLDATQTTDVGEALHILEHRFGSVRNYVKLVESRRNEELLAAIRYLQEMEPIPSDVANLLIRKKTDIITSEKDYETFMSRFKEFKEGYKASYVEEHQLSSNLLAGFCEGFQENLHFKLLNELDRINKKFLRKPLDQISHEIDNARSCKCSVDEQTLGVILDEHPRCTCDYRPKGIARIREETADRERAFFVEIQSLCSESLQILLQMLSANRSRFEALLSEAGLVEVGREFERKLETICKKPGVPEHSELQCLLDYLGKLGCVLQQTFGDVAPPPPRYPLSTLISELRAEKGRSVTVGALVEWLRRKYGETEEIDIDLP